MIRMIYRILSLLNWANAAQRGPGAVVRRYERIQGYKMVNRVVGRSGRRRRR